MWFQPQESCTNCHPAEQLGWCERPEGPTRSIGVAKADSADSAGKYEMYTLYARAGWGSALIETQLAWYGLPSSRKKRPARSCARSILS
jgi:hypothetical protein